jgi:receptor protein-tyrosine kinase
MGITEALAAMRRRWWLPFIGLLAGGLAALAASLVATPMYRADTQLFVSTTESTSTSDVFTGSQFSQQRVASYAELLKGDELAGRVITRLGLKRTERAVAASITATPVPNTVLLDVTVTDPSPQGALAIADAVGGEFSALVSDLERPEDSSVSPVKVTVVDRPTLPERPSEPQTTRNVLLGGLVGLLVGCLGAIARQRLDRTVQDPDEASRLAGASVIGTILRDDALAETHVINRSKASRTAEEYRGLRTNLQFLNVDEPPKVIMISSAVPSEGKTTVTINLALAMAEAGNRVTIVEADLRRPKVTAYLGMVGGVGLTNVLAGTAGLDEVLQPYRHTTVSVVASGPIPPNPGELLASSQMAALLDKLKGLNDFVVVDAPPLLPVADATGLAAHVDGVLLSVRYGKTTKQQLQQASVALERVHATTLGIILNIVPPKSAVATAFGYGYGYGPELDPSARSSG